MVQITYSSNQEDGVYGYEFLKDADGNVEILQQGKYAAIDNFNK